MSLQQVSSFGGAGGVYLTRHLSKLVESLSCEVHVSTKSTTKIERNRLINAFKDGYLKASPRSRSAAIYKLICAQHGITPLIFHAAKSSTRYGYNSWMGKPSSPRELSEMTDRIKSIVEIAGGGGSRRSQSTLVCSTREGTYFYLPSHAGMNPDAFMETVGREFFPVRDPEECLEALRFVNENRTIHFRTTKHGN